MVNWCPEGTNEILDSKCRKDTNGGGFNYTYLLDVPVVSSNSGMIYQNIFCGQCQGQYYFDSYDYTISCDCEIDNINANLQVMNLEYDPGNLTWRAPRSSSIRCLESDLITCRLTIDFPRDLGNMCEEKVIDTCLPGKGGLFEEQLEEGCVNGTYYLVGDKNSSVYKNYKCSLCNGVAIHNIICLQLEVHDGTVVGRNDLWTVSDLFNWDNDCDPQYYIQDPIFGGCDLIENLPEEVIDAVNNMTNDLNGTEVVYPDSPPSAESIVFTVMMSISTVCLFLHLIIFFIVGDYKKLHSLNLFSMCLALFLAQVFFVFGANICHTFGGCYAMSVIVYYLFLAAFFWMNVISFDICKTFHSKGVRTHSIASFTKYSIYAWGIPVIMLMCALTIDIAAEEAAVAPAFAKAGFWFGTLGGLLLFFIIPVEVIFCFNTFMLIIAANEIRKQKKMGKMAAASSKRGKAKKESVPLVSEEENRKIHRLITGKIKKTLDEHKNDIKNLKLDASLAILMGIPWIFAALVSVSVVFNYLFNIFNSLQGVFIFVAFDCQNKVWRNVKARLTGKSAVYSMTGTGTTSSTRTNSTSSGGSRIKNRRAESNLSKSTVDSTVSYSTVQTVHDSPSASSKSVPLAMSKQITVKSKSSVRSSSIDRTSPEFSESNFSSPPSYNETLQHPNSEILPKMDHKSPFPTKEQSSVQNYAGKDFGYQLESEDNRNLYPEIDEAYELQRQFGDNNVLGSSQKQGASNYHQEDEKVHHRNTMSSIPDASSQVSETESTSQLEEKYELPRQTGLPEEEIYKIQRQFQSPEAENCDLQHQMESKHQINPPEEEKYELQRQFGSTEERAQSESSDLSSSDGPPPFVVPPPQLSQKRRKKRREFDQRVQSGRPRHRYSLRQACGTSSDSDVVDV